ncbi:hypothetical protein DM02DRAFT_415582 [Periconia macrospinosa]|uniref:Uncharacterized protein n=1 Tax=Periconia macrospinosa TaxID=97972 RepID=A0A2V1CZQ5_9PLEO|nr:hypothetical protein DM02DRAFT_415582 [Periconia macrospinosa]
MDTSHGGLQYIRRTTGQYPPVFQSTMRSIEPISVQTSSTEKSRSEAMANRVSSPPSPPNPLGGSSLESSQANSLGDFKQSPSPLPCEQVQTSKKRKEDSATEIDQDAKLNDLEACRAKTTEKISTMIQSLERAEKHIKSIKDAWIKVRERLLANPYLVATIDQYSLDITENVLEKLGMSPFPPPEIDIQVGHGRPIRNSTESFYVKDNEN